MNNIDETINKKRYYVKNNEEEKQNELSHNGWSLLSVNKNNWIYESTSGDKIIGSDRIEYLYCIVYTRGKKNDEVLAAYSNMEYEYIGIAHGYIFF